MAKGSRRDATDETTKQVRVFEDVGEMISMIVRVEGGTTANLLDPLIRPQITARYNRHREAIEKIRAAEKELERAEQDAKRSAAQDNQPKRKRAE
jgi:hypothetical protein